MLGGSLVAALFVAPPTAALPAAPPATQSPSASATQPASPNAPQIWLIGDTKFAFRPVPIGFPLKAGTLTATNHKEASHPGENLDNAVEYYSPDRAVFATIYIYLPGLAHSGLAAIAEDWTIRKNWPSVTGGEMKIVAAGGVDRAAIRASYGRYDGHFASAAAYLKAGRWLVTVRVSGPEDRRAEVEAAMDALLLGTTFGNASPVHHATLLSVTDCPQGGADKPARPQPDLHGAKLAALAVLSEFDGGGNQATNESGAREDLPPRVPTALCRVMLPTKQGPVPLLKGPDGDSIFVDGRSVRLVLLSDSGAMLEVDHLKNFDGYVLLHHDLGATDFLGMYDGIPSDKQLSDILNGNDREGARIRVPVRFAPGKGPQIYLPQEPAPNAAAQPSKPPTSSR